MTSPPKQVIIYCRVITVLLLLFPFHGILKAQVVTPSVVNTNGFTGRMATGFISISVGESAVSTLNGPNGIITQGFLQPELKPPCLDFELDYFPNPFIDKITIRDSACGRAISEIEIFDLLGNRVRRTRLVNREADLGFLEIGVFVVRGYSGSGQLLGTFKILKIEG